MILSALNGHGGRDGKGRIELRMEEELVRDMDTCEVN